MKTLTATYAILAAAFLFGGLQAGCGGDDTTGSGGSGGGGAGGSGGGGTGGSAESFTFDPTPLGNYVQVERHGAVEAGTVGIALAAGLGPKYPHVMGADDISLRDAYNASNPAEDAANKWAMEISNSVNTLQSVLKDDLMSLGLTPANLATALAQAGPVIIPDTIKYDPSKPVGYPNGRALEDQVVDITIAAALLDLSVHPLSFFADLPLNPPANDVPFKTSFPYLADPH